MADKSAIEWTDATWNPIRARNKKTGKVGWHCEHATTGCELCYAEGFNKRLGTGLSFKPGHRKDIEIFLDEAMLTQPLRWKRPRMIFVCSMTDLFAEFVEDRWLDRMFAVMGACEEKGLGHTFQILTKRPARMLAWMNEHGHKSWNSCRLSTEAWPARNVWLGVSAERQQEWDERLEQLGQTPATVRFVSVEPMLGPIDPGNAFDRAAPEGSPYKPIDWIICGGESGPKARPMHPDWARSMRDDCAAAGVAFFFKQWGEYLPVGQSLPGFGKVHGATAVKPCRMKLHYAGTPKQAPKHAFAERGVEFRSTTDDRLTFRVGKKAAGRLLDGVEYNAMPKVPA
jgi:protein gp37